MELPLAELVRILTVAGTGMPRRPSLLSCSFAPMRPPTCRHSGAGTTTITGNSAATVQDEPDRASTCTAAGQAGPHKRVCSLLDIGQCGNVVERRRRPSNIFLTPDLKGRAEAMCAATQPAVVTTYQLRVTLREVSPLMWRRLLVRSDTTIAQLHDWLQIAMGWGDSVHEDRRARARHPQRLQAPPTRRWQSVCTVGRSPFHPLPGPRRHARRPMDAAPATSRHQRSSSARQVARLASCRPHGRPARPAAAPPGAGLG